METGGGKPRLPWSRKAGMDTSALREMPSSLNDACRKLELAADEIDRLTLECRAHKSEEDRTYHRLITEHLNVERLRAALQEIADHYIDSELASKEKRWVALEALRMDVSAECRKEISDIDAFVRR